MSSTDAGSTAVAAADLGMGITGLAQAGAGALLLVVGLLLLTGWSKPLTRVAAQLVPMGRVAKLARR